LSKTGSNGAAGGASSKSAIPAPKTNPKAKRPLGLNQNKIPAPPPSAPNGTPKPSKAKPVKFWRQLLQCNQVKINGVPVGWVPKPTSYNAAIIMTHHPAWKGSFFYNEFSEQIIKSRSVPVVNGLDKGSSKPGPWIDEDTAAARVWFQAVEKMIIPAADFALALVHASRQNRKHPVREYLNERKWDGKSRIDTVLVDYFGVEDTLYARGVSRCWFISAVARIMEPGCQADYALILEGPQGLGKSRALRHLMPSGKGSWFSETGIVIGNKDSYQNIHGVWIYCLDEMASVHVADVRTMKNFLTSPDDRYRPPFGHVPQNFLRQNIFACTINPEAGGYFADRTGNRRYWPVYCTKLDIEGLVKVRDQIWAEARAVYSKPMPSAQRPVASRWWPDAKLTALCVEEQKKRLHIEPWTEVIDGWIKSGCPRRDEDNHFTTDRVNTARGLTTSEVLQHALGVNPAQMSVGSAMKAARILKELGFGHSQQETHGGVRDRYYKPGAPVLKQVVQPKSIKT
jgi:putative DNA primase/helicase